MAPFSKIIRTSPTARVKEYTRTYIIGKEVTVIAVYYRAYESQDELRPIGVTAPIGFIFIGVLS